MPRPFDVQRIDHLVLRVSDLARSIAFYRDVLGCDMERQREHLGLVHLRARCSTSAASSNGSMRRQR